MRDLILRGRGDRALRELDRIRPCASVRTHLLQPQGRGAQHPKQDRGGRGEAHGSPLGPLAVRLAARRAVGRNRAECPPENRSNPFSLKHSAQAL